MTLPGNAAVTVFAIGSAADENLPALQAYIAVDGTADEEMSDDEMSDEDMSDDEEMSEDGETEE